MCVPNFRSLTAASRGFDIMEFFLKIFGPLTFKIVLPAMKEKSTKYVLTMLKNDLLVCFETDVIYAIAGEVLSLIVSPFTTLTRKMRLFQRSLWSITTFFYYH